MIIQVNQTKKEHKHSRWRKRLLLFFIANILLVLFILLGGMLFIRHRLTSLPVIDAQYLSSYEPSKILDKNGGIIWQPTDQRTTILTYDEIPDFYKTAIVAVEDQTFWESSGVSIKGLVNMVYGVLRNKVDPDYTPRGGSTIDQQLIKNKFYDGGTGHEVTTRKIQELFLAMQLNENFTKKEILTFYVNDLEYAEGATGLGTIMKTYFNKTPADYTERTTETIAELSYLAGLSQAPSSYNLYTHPEAAQTRMQTVLRILLEEEKITNEEYTAAKAFDLTTNLQPRGWEAKEQVQKNLKYKHYTDGVMEELSEMGYDLRQVSLTIHTYFDPALSDKITALVQDPKYYLDDQQQTGVTVVDQNGIVVALVGSSKPGDEFNRALSDVRSSGSSMKPFTAYGPLLQYFGNQYNTASTFDTSDYPYPGTNAVMHNFGYGTYGYQTMQKSLRYSYNTPVGRIDDEILGSLRIKTFLHGLNLDVKDTYSSVDGIGLNVSPLQSAAAYNALNNLGTYTKPRFIQKLVFSDGTEKEIEPTTRQAMNPSVAYVLNQMLRGVPAGDGTAGYAKIPSYQGYAGKTGSVKFDDSVNPPAPYGEGSSDVWYCSYTNAGYSIAVWCGYDTPNTSPQIPNYYKGYQDINRDLQLLLNGNRAVTNWSMPSGVKQLSGSGLSAQYAVTDSKDLQETGIVWENVDGYEQSNIQKAIADTKIPKDWEKYESSSWYSYYKTYGTDVSDIIGKDVYSKMKGD